MDCTVLAGRGTASGAFTQSLSLQPVLRNLMASLQVLITLNLNSE
jgi:hypothetical protein